MDVLMPDGTLVTGVPEGITQSDLLARYGKFSASKAEAAAPTLSPEEQVMSAATAPPTGIAGLRKPSNVPEMTPYTPSLTESLMELIPGNKAKAANEYAARKAAEERRVSPEEIYKGAGGYRPMLNPEGRAPVLAATEAAPILYSEAKNIPQQVNVAALQAVRAGNIGAPGQETFLDKTINYMTPETPKGEQDKNYEALQGLSKSIGFSLASMVSSIVGGAAGTSVAGPAGGIAGGMAASGAVAYRASKDDFLSRVRDKLNQESLKLYNKPISKTDWENAKQEFDSAASSYGAWEAVPEALSNAIMLKAFTGPARIAAGAGRLEQFMVKNKVAEKAASFVTEHVTETTTGLGQRSAELKAGLSTEELSIADAFRQQFIQTLLMTGGMQVGEKATHAAAQFYKDRVEPHINPGSALGKAIMADLNATEFSQSGINKEAVARLSPQSYQPELISPEKTAKPKQGVAMAPPPPEEPPATPPAPPKEPPPTPPAPTSLTAAPSESMDTEAMLREALGEKPTVSAATVKEPKAQIQPTVAESGPFVRKQMEAQTPTTPTPVSIEGTPSATEAPKAVEAEAQGQQAPAAPVTPTAPVTPKKLEETPEQEITRIRELLKDTNISMVQRDYLENRLDELTQQAKPPAVTAEAPTEQTKLPGRAVTEVPLNKLTLSEDVPQFKADANKAGVVEPLGGKFERTGVAPIQVWRRTDGRLEVISGRHRFDLAKRSGEKTIPAQIHDEASGFNRDMAAVLDAELNIRDGQGKVKDYVNYFKGTGLDQKTADSRGLLARAPGKRAFTIANQGSDELVAGVRADQIGDEAAYLIALNAPNDARLQGVAIKAIQDGKSATSAINLMQAVKALAGESDTTTDMFGFDDSAMKEAEAMAKIAAAKQREMQTRLAAISGAAKNPAVAKSEGIDIKDPVAVKRRIEELRRMKVAWDSWSTNPDLVAEIRAERGTPAPELKTRNVEEEIPPAIETEIDQLFGSVEDAEQMVEDNLTPQEQDNELEKARNEQTKGEGNAEKTEPKGEDLFAEPSEEETLTKPTPEGLRAKEEYRNKAEAAEAAEAKANKEAEDKAKADKEVGEFTLTGSERAADVEAARGQKDLLAEEAPEEEGVKVVPFEADSSTVGELLSETRDEENPFDIRYNALMHAADKPAKPKPQEMLTPEEAKAKLEEWKAEAKRQGKSHKNQNRTIMSLFDASGEWSQPWVDAGYNVWTFDIQNGEDINDFSAEFLLNEGFGDMEIWGILAAPPCTDFASSGAQFWAKKDAKGQTEASNELVMQVLRTVEFLQPKIWAMENPVGRIAKLNNLPPAHLTFDPNYYGDPYTKKTLLWGNFDNDLPMAPVEPTEGSKIVKLSGKDKYARSLTPEGFAYAFFMANNAENMTPAERLTRTYYGVDPKAFEGATEAHEEAIKESNNPAFEDNYYDGNLDEAADIARDIIGKEKEEAPAKTEDVIQVNGKDIPVTMHRLEKENQLVEVNTDVFDKAFSKSTWQYVGEGGEGGIEGRYKKFAEFIKDAKSIEAPNVSVDKDGAIVFGDGRHRYAYLRDSGVKNIPLSMDAESVKNAEKFGYIGKQEGVKPEPVETPEGRNLRYPMAAVLFNDGYEVLALDNPRTYVDKGGEPHRTFEKDGVRISLTPQLVLFQNKNAVLTGQGESTDLVINALLVDQAKRNQGKANEALQNIVDAADQYGVTLYIEPVPLVNLKEKNFGLDSQQLEDLYKKFGFDFAEDSNKVMVRDPEVEVLGPAEKPAAPQLKNEPYTIEGDFTEIGEEKQHLLLTNQTSKLSEDQTKTLESQYGAKRDSTEFLDSLRKDVIAFITEGAKAVNGKIRAIIRQVANGVLTVAIVFNPQFVSKPYTIAVPQYDITTSEVIKDLPKEAQSMSDAAKRAYGVIYPALEAQLKEKDKLFIVADKRSGNTYLFNPDGSLLLQSKTLFGKAIGDYMHGDNEIVANRITPAGVFDLGLRDAKRSAGEAYTAGDYDFGKVFVLDKSHMGSNGPYSNTIMHSVWTHETDAKQRLAALEKPGAEDSRYSFGCINVNKETFKYLITNHLNQMDGAKIFIVPENGANVMDFINGKAMNSDDIIRQKVEPVTKTTVTEKKVPAPKQEVERKVAGRETEVAKLEVKTEEKAPKKPGETNTFYSLDAYVTEEDKKRSPSLKRAIKTLNRMRLDGRITDEQFVERADAAIIEDEQQRLSKDIPARQRGYLLIQERLSAAVRRGELSRESFDLASWFMSQNEDLVKDLGVSVKGKGEAGVGGFYDALYRVANIIKGGSSDLTAVHEILHHLERMMPAKVQQAIRKTWASQLAKAAKNAKTPAEKLYFAALMEAHYGSNRHSMLNIPEGAGKDYAKVRAAMEDKGDSSADFAQEMLKLGLVPMANYEYVNPSEFWAVNGTDIVKGRYDAVKGGVLARLKNWLKELGQKIKSIFGMKSDASIIRALDSLAKSDGEFVTKDMLGQGNYLSIKNYKGNAAPTALWDSPEKTFLTDLEYQLVDKQVDLKDVIKQINKTVGTIDERLDAYTKETLYHGRAAERIKDFLEDKLRPLFEQMKKDGVSQEQLEEYLHNRHAEERNDQINKINLSPDVYDKGSGIDTTDAQNYLASLSAQDRVKLQSLAAKVDNIIEGTQQTLVDNGLETQETIDTWNKTYKHYVPLQRDDLDFIHTGSGYAGGYGTKGSASKRAVGSVKPVKDIIANIAIQREKAIRRGEQARVGRALYALAITNPNPKFWLPINPNAIKNRANLIQEMVSLGLTIQDAENLIKPLATPQIDKVTGLVKYEVNRNSYNSDNVFPVRINGEDRFIVFNPSDERAKRMSESLKNLNQEELGWALGTMGQVTRWISSVNTQYNPVFGAWNMARDVESAAFNLSTTEIAGHEKEVLRGTLPAMFAIYRDLRGKAANTPEQQAWIDDFNEMRLAGGTTGYSQQFSQGRDKANIVEKEFKRLNQNTARKAAQKVFDWLSDYNDAMENAVRLSAYRVALRETGSVDKAASIAKELTVNFNRKGASGPTMQALYSFINASIQGTKRLLQTLKGPMGKKIIAGGIMLGVAQAIALALNGYDDGDPPEFLKDKNFIIPIPFMGSNYIIIPMPMGLNIFPGIGRILTEAVLIKGGLLKSNKGPGDKAVSMLSLVLDSFNPLGAGSIYQQLTPTAFDPLVAAFVANKDAFGRPISREDRPTAPTPGYERSRDSATVISQGLAMFMNWSTSPYGTKHTKGFLSPTADQIDYVVGQYTGGVGREVLKGAETIKNKVAGEETPSYRIPIVGKLYGETKTPTAISSKFYDNVIQMSEYEHEIKQREKNNEPTEKYMKENPSARLWKEANSFEREVGKINKEKREAVQRKASRQEIKRIEDKRVAKMKEFNDKVRSTQ